MRRIAELESQGHWMDPSDLKRLSTALEEPSYVERLSVATQWTKVCEAAKKIGHEWQIERKYRRILTKKLAGGVRKVVREKVIKKSNNQNCKCRIIFIYYSVLINCMTSSKVRISPFSGQKSSINSFTSSSLSTSP